MVRPVHEWCCMLGGDKRKRYAGQGCKAGGVDSIQPLLKEFVRLVQACTIFRIRIQIKKHFLSLTCGAGYPGIPLDRGGCLIRPFLIK